MNSPIGDTSSTNAQRLAPEEYPWAPTDRQGVLVGAAFTPSEAIDTDLRTIGTAPLSDRHAVIAVGSNASPEVMHRKLSRHGVDGPLPMTIRLISGIGVGHSAHVSLPGYIATAPYRCSHCRHRLVVLHLDGEQLDAVDATEPNYDRVRHDDAWLYASRWQVLAIRGVPITARTQPALQDVLRSTDSVWRDRFAGMSAAEVSAALAHDGTVAEWRHRWMDVGLTRNAGFSPHGG